MSIERDAMITALKEHVVSVLKARGFKGSFPHFRRLSPQQIDLLTFQFDKWGGGFVIEIATCPPEGFTTSWGKHIPPNQVRAFDLHPNQRPRLQPRKGSSTDDWFRFDRASRDIKKPIFIEIAESVVPFLSTAETYWKTPTSHHTK